MNRFGVTQIDQGFARAGRLLEGQPPDLVAPQQASQKQTINAIAKALSPEGYDLRAESESLESATSSLHASRR